MTDREIYVTVFAATVGGYMACSQRVTLASGDGERMTIDDYAHRIAQYAIKNAPKDRHRRPR